MWVDMFVKIGFSTFSVSFSEIILKNDGVQIFTTLGDFLLLCQPKAFHNKLNVPITYKIDV